MSKTESAPCTCKHAESDHSRHGCLRSLVATRRGECVEVFCPCKGVPQWMADIANAVAA